VGSYRGFEIVVRASGTPADLLSSLFSQTEMSLRLSANDAAYSFNVGENDAGIIQSMDAQLRGLETRLEQACATRRELRHRYEQINAELNKGWEHAAGYQEMKARLDLVNASLSRAGCEIEPSPELSNLEADALLPVPAVNVRQLVSIAAEDTPATVNGPVVAGTTDSSVSIDPPKLARVEQIEDSEPQPAPKTGESDADHNQVERKDDLVVVTSFINQPQPTVAQKHKTAKRRAALPSLVSDESEQLSFNWA
jgi:hypothetical protein